MTSFFPKEEKKYMEDSRYFKMNQLEDGEECKIRILSRPIVGWEDWDENGKPVRFLPENEPNESIIPGKTVRKFVAMLIWNYELEKVQIWSFTQVRVRNSLKTLDIKKGDPTKYDISVIKIGEGQTTQYILKGLSPSAAPKEASDSLRAKPVNLYALYVGEDPWSYSGTMDEFDAQEVSNDSSVA